MSKIEKQLSLYREGLTYKEIGKRTGSTAAEVQRRVRAWKQQPKESDPIRSAEELKTLRDRIVELRQQGLTMKAIGRRVGITEILVYGHLRTLGIE